MKHIEYFVNDKQLAIVTEFLDGAISLRNVIEKTQKSNEYLTEQYIGKILLQLASAINYFQIFGIIHTDIKPENILLCQDGRVKIFNFDNSMKAQATPQKISNKDKSVIYMSPEMIFSESYSFSTDIWNLGCVIHELMTMKHPISYNQTVFLDKIQAKQPITFVKLPYSNDLKQTVLEMLNFNQFFRIDVKTLVKLPFLENFK